MLDIIAVEKTSISFISVKIVVGGTVFSAMLALKNHHLTKRQICQIELIPCVFCTVATKVGFLIVSVEFCLKGTYKSVK